MARLSASAAEAGYRLETFDEIGSTNALALERGAAGETRPTWYVTDRQTAGRGRRGRNWATFEGNLFATLLLTDPAPVANVAELCFVAALALDDAILAVAPGAFDAFNLKWPNDGLLGGAKVAGILIEATTRGRLTQVAIGIGVNIAGHPDDTPYPTTSFAAKGFAFDRDQLFEALSASMVRALAVWDRGARFAQIRAGWLARAAGLGGPLVLRTDGRRVEGIFTGLDPQGRLILDTPDGRELITAGEVLLAPADAGR
ncbi:biotin--[acetyl-CoA-carboxylase] ligase [Phreatobacter sp. AB_2022a]|uniref:biotin--[acetyl-CoA-carboxylase] ligase n=1 Tax=Phreatobacter sp. AB_2022a TaxID=3003134 RepID=UPI0022875B89|nr:biotin--[acetyl-CoA-carboxylase] ligase [Phreatobacter sp. AB_2022a]MCZ0738494.1 biotin--[acetyl-CoA-carboxylase] ligase [Phreatobacter sp. AB_2022a]